MQEKEKQILPPSRHFHFLSTVVLDITSFPGSLSYLWERSLETRLLLTNQHRWNCLVIVKKHLSPHENLLPPILRIKYRSRWKVLFKQALKYKYIKCIQAKKIEWVWLLSIFCTAAASKNLPSAVGRIAQDDLSHCSCNILNVYKGFLCQECSISGIFF